ncbi:hypothetical protein [Ruminiclostridium papyrosolvens]|uniref:Uncharacterized protein n=1 Tax=Ruminiclostridium papyrosolvens C7 TaxID=1330534 RepID=U4R692_9FIRM|nr:hypothetical protein [Ruminiclostridium papyrosolvens]EPR14287.1 hypothetical protein L323_00360 [Ruminiclostridium papyrosolvens C7]
MGNAYERQFHIFKTMDNNWENPGGFIKVEINGDNTRFQLSLNNLSDKKDSAYSLYGIHKDGDMLKYSDICRIQPINGRIDMKTNFPSEEIGSNKLNVQEINIFAVICRSTDNKASGTVKCPLVAYTKGEQVWKEQFERLLEQPAATKNEIAPEPKAEDKTIYQAIPEEPETEAALTEQDGVIDETEIINIQPWTVIEEEGCENYSETPESESTEQERGDFEANKDAEEDNLSAKDAPIPDLSSKFQEGLSSVYESSYEEEEREIEKPEESESVEPEESEEAQNVWKRIQEDFNDISSIKVDESEEGEQQGEDRDRSFNMQLLKQELDNSFEEYNPFRTRNRSFRWWKINSPGFLNNILFRNNIKTYLLFNPKVMLAHYKYRYIILGIRNTRQPGKEKLICGIPGVYSIDDNPFNNVGSWVQMEGFRPKYGAFGYWIVMLDPRTGKISKMR